MSITVLLVIVTCLISFTCFSNQELFNNLKHFPYAEKHHNQYYRFLTGGFVHGGTLHLFINMFVLYEFGRLIENLYIDRFGLVGGRVTFTLLYLGIIILANISTYIKHKDHQHFASVGASGGTSGIVFIFCMIMPWAWLGLFFVIPIPAIVFAGLYVFYSSWASKNSRDMIDHDAHLYGALAGIVLTFILIPDLASSFVDQILQGPTWPPPRF